MDQEEHHEKSWNQSHYKWLQPREREGGIHFLGASADQPPLQSLATTTLDKNFVLMATFTLSLTENRLGTIADLNTLDSHKSNQQI